MDPDASTDLHPLLPFAGPALADGVRVAASARRAGPSLVLVWVLDDPHGVIRVPPPAGTPARRDGLWEHTCVEAFVAAAGGAAYWEVNLSPSGDWNVYRFARYRDGMAEEDRIAVLPTRRLADARGALHVETTFAVAALGELAGGALDVGLTAVLERRDGERCHLAVTHAGTHPDFHRRESFVVRVGRA